MKQMHLPLIPAEAGIQTESIAFDRRERFSHAVATPR
jgi:hypothetical protein